MAKILLDYAVDFTQVSGTATASLAFLHNIGVITAQPLITNSAVITNADGNTSTRATVRFDGVFTAGTVVTVSGVQTPLVPPEWEVIYTVIDELSATELVAIIAPLVSVTSQIQGTPNGSVLEVHSLGGGETVTILIADIDVAGATPLASQIIEVFDPQELQYLTDSPEDLIAGFDGGLSKMYVVMLNDIADAPALLLDKEGDFFTLYSSRDYTEDEGLTAMAGWQGVKGLTYTVQADAKIAGAVVNTCAFFEDVTTPLDARAYFGIYSFAKLLSANAWRNQQYTPVAPQNGAPVTTLGQAESLFDDRISFYLHDNEQGTRLAFFVAGGKSITDPYIDMEVQVVIQSEMLNYLASTQPMNIETNRRQLEQIGNTVLGGYTDSGLLDPDGINHCTIRKSNEAFIVNGEITTTNSEALWRVQLDALESTTV